MINPFKKSSRGNRIVHFINNKLVFNVLGDSSKLRSYAQRGWYPYYLTYIPRTDCVVAVNYTKQNARINCQRLLRAYDEKAVIKLAFADSPYGYKVSDNRSMTENYLLSSTPKHSKYFNLYADIFGIALILLIATVNIFIA